MDLHGVGTGRRPAPFADFSPWCFFCDSNTNFEYAGAVRDLFERFARIPSHMSSMPARPERSVLQGCLASGYLFSMVLDTVFRWLLASAIPPESCRPWFLQRCACTYADDYALATASLREAIPRVSTAFATIDRVVGMALDNKKCHWIQDGNLSFHQLAEWVGTYVPDFWPMQISDHAKYLGVVNGPGAPAHKRTEARNKLNIAYARIRASRRAWCRGLVRLSLSNFMPSLFSPLLVQFVNLTMRESLLKIWPFSLTAGSLATAGQCLRLQN